MLQKYSLLLSVLLLTVFSGCSRRETPDADTYGLLGLSFSQDLGEVVVTRGDASGEPMIFAVSVLNEAGVIVRSTDDHREFETEPLRLRPGTYTVRATHGTDADAAFDAPFYSGETQVEVVADQTVRATVSCSLANVKVTALMDESITQNFSSYVLTVENGKGGCLIFDEAAGTLDKAGYFHCTGTLEWMLNLTNASGQSYEMTDVITDVRPRQHYRLLFRVDPDGNKTDGGFSVSVSVDEETNDSEHQIDISLNKKPKPVLSGDGFNVNERLFVQSGSAAAGTVRVRSEAGTARWVLTHTEPVFEELGLPGKTDLSGLAPEESAALREAGLDWTDLSARPVDAELRLGPFLARLPLGSYRLDFKVVDGQCQYVVQTLVLEVVPAMEISTLDVDAWARFADVRAQWNTLEPPAGMAVQYRRESDSEWTTVSEGLETDAETRVFRVRLTGLDDATDYRFRAVSAKDQANEISFRTEEALQMPNFGYDLWNKPGKSWYANADQSAANFWWDSGNEGTAIANRNATTPEPSFLAVPGEGKQAARLESISILGVFAGGNIYSGDFLGTVGMSGGRIAFGRPYASRPLALEGYYCYEPKAISHTKAPYEHLKGQMDQCHIFVILADWDQPFEVNNASGPFLDIVNDPHIIAYGELVSGESTGGEYRKFRIDLTYRNGRKPKYAVVSSVASRYADYFTGGEGSLMYVDEYQFLFE